MSLLLGLASPAGLQAAHIQWTGTGGTVPPDGNVYYIDCAMALTGGLHIMGSLDVRSSGTLSDSGQGVYVYGGGSLRLWGQFRSVGVVANGMHSQPGQITVFSPGAFSLTQGTVWNNFASVLDIAGGGSFVQTGGEFVNGRSGGGTLRVDGGYDLSRGSLVNEAGGTVTGNGTVTMGSQATLRLLGGSVSVQEIDNRQNGTFSFDGGMLSVGTYRGDMVCGGTLAPGRSVGRTAVYGDLTVAPLGALRMELAGVTPAEASTGNPGEHDALYIDGAAILGGTLEVTLDAGFVPAEGDVFDLFDWHSVQGEFAVVDLPDLPGHMVWDTSALYSAGEIAVMPEPATLALLAAGGMALLLRRRK